MTGLSVRWPHCNRKYARRRHKCAKTEPERRSSRVGECWPTSTLEGKRTVKPGDTVWLKEANVPATVLSVSAKTQQLEVQAGSTKIRLGIDGVARVTSPTGGDRGWSAPAIITGKSRSVPAEFHLRGKRAEEVEWLLNGYIDDASLAGLHEVRIVHGSGTGTLRSIVRELLPHHPLVKSFRPGGRGEGGNGVTVAQL